MHSTVEEMKSCEKTERKKIVAISNKQCGRLEGSFNQKPKKKNL